LFFVVLVFDGARQVRRSVDAIKHPRLRAVELLISLAIFISELDGEFEVRAMKARVSTDLAAAAAEYARQFRYS
jgi:hypothetical protein